MQVAKCLDANLRARGVGVVLDAEHTCMTQRAIRPRRHHRHLGPAGHAAHGPRSRAELFALARVPTSANI